MDKSAFGEDARSGNVARLHDETAERHADDLALEMHGTEITHRQLRDRSARFAGGLRELGAGPDDRVLLYLPNCPEYVVATLGTLKAGAVASPMNPQYKAREIGHQLRDTEASVVVTHAALREHLTEALRETDRSPTVVTVGGPDAVPEGDVPFPEVDGDPTTVERESEDVALQPYTSGTTGQPKGVLLTHRNLRAQAFSGFELVDVEPDEDRSLAVLPLYHITGFVHSTWQTLIRGGAVYVRDPSRWDAEDAMRTIEEEGITGFIGVAAMYVDLVNHEAFGEYDLSSLRETGQGGAKMPVAVQEEFESVAGVDTWEGYGLTETTAATHTGAGTTFGHKLGTIGQPLRMTDCKIVDESGEEVPPGEEGELLVRGPQVMKGYHDLPEASEQAFTESGYFRTGDVARRDADNYYEIIDRKKHMINTAGYNVYPSEVEELLFEHEGVADAAVVGIPDERRGETVKAFVVPTPETDVTPEELKQFCLDNLAEYKHPREVEFVEELPRTASGKVQKFKLVEDEES
ncbi:class I adenylate-forming enzyme family protein [Halorussus sp. MSC15.2]|uniref:class I adenylate-forming enzyme family protein n=1 Tax=Halorussus sp. MSC15.2 TaxID=2283638 RepID=UPI0013CFBB38|nr:AMP-binding protein [Halorussus sp. MSC15.2]NEU57789.1 long-chain fatty acid--CoA ligase [Halorussus sp. MSC15.2]